jgi:hypothetical protein
MFPRFFRPQYARLIASKKGGDVMQMKSVVLATAFAVALAGVSVAQQQATPVQPSPIKRTLVGKADVPGSNYEAVTAVVEIAPGFKAGRHSHPGVVFAQVTEGE